MNVTEARLLGSQNYLMQATNDAINRLVVVGCKTLKQLEP
jgi:hypothetical protein